MLEKFLKNNETLRLFEPSDKILLTVSSGIDSVSMLHLFHQAEIDFGVAHCNFQLRGKDADDDQLFVKSLAAKHNKAFYTVNFNTKGYANEHGISIQMAARDLRYNWFKEIASQYNYTKVATAHNRDDVVETFLLNISRGTGIRGLTGIAEKNINIIRPLLFASREEIEEYVRINHLSFREDSSNAEIKYKRNMVRHQLIPLFKILNPSFSETVIQETEILRSVNKVFQSKVDEIKNEAVKIETDRILLEIAKLKEYNTDSALLFELLEPYGFSSSDVQEIWQSKDSQSGKKFISNKSILVKDRKYFIIEPLREKKSEEYIIDKPNLILEEPVKMKLNLFQKTDSFKLPKDQQNVALDYDTIQFPLKLRHWKKGDSFQPLGIKGTKKISDFFTDRKIPLTEKDKIWLLTAEERIIWIVGFQISDQVKVTEATKNILLIERIG